MLNLGIGLYDLCVVGTFFLGYALMNRGAWVEKPAFSAYILMCSVRLLVLHPLFRSDYASFDRTCWYWAIAALPVVGAAVGEHYKQKAAGFALGAFAGGLALAMLLQGRALLALGDIPGATARGELVISIVRYAGLFFALVALSSVRGISGIASGLAITLTISSLALGHKEFQFASTAAWIVALFLWLDWVRTYRVESRATTYKPIQRSSRRARGAAFSDIPQPCK